MWHGSNFMGRKKLNRTEAELAEQSNNRSKRYYQRNKERIRKERMQRYWQEKDGVEKKLS